MSDAAKTGLYRSRTLSVSIDCAPDRLYQFASRPENFPTWVTSFVTGVKHTEQGWILETTEGSVGIAFVPDNEFGVLDHRVTVAPGVEILNPMRVVPNGTGCEVLFTLFQQPSMSDEQFERDAGMVERDLGTLKGLMEHS
jgi:hypothetical protein